MNLMMKPKIKVYLDTSVISALFDDRNPDRKELTETFFNSIDQYETYISSITNAEIDRTPEENIKQQMKNLVNNFHVLETDDNINTLALQYVKNGAFPKQFQEDAYHVAFAVIYEVDYLLSWNFKHLVKEKTRAIVRMVNTLNKYRQIDIITPAELTWCWW